MRLIFIGEVFFTQVPEDFRNGTAPREVVHFDFLYVGSSGPEGSEGLPEEDGFRYILVIMDDLSNFVSLEPAEACTAEVTAKSCSMGAPVCG